MTIELSGDRRNKDRSFDQTKGSNWRWGGEGEGP